MSCVCSWFSFHMILVLLLAALRYKRSNVVIPVRLCSQLQPPFCFLSIKSTKSLTSNCCTAVLEIWKFLFDNPVFRQCVGQGFIVSVTTMRPSYMPRSCTDAPPDLQETYHVFHFFMASIVSRLTPPPSPSPSPCSASRMLSTPVGCILHHSNTGDHDGWMEPTYPVHGKMTADCKCHTNKYQYSGRCKSLRTSRRSTPSSRAWLSATPSTDARRSRHWPWRASAPACPPSSPCWSASTVTRESAAVTSRSPTSRRRGPRRATRCSSRLTAATRWVGCWA